MRTEIPAILPAMPPAVVPALELCPIIGICVTEFDEEPRETLLVEHDRQLELEAVKEG